MKDIVLLELAKRWELEATSPNCEDGSPNCKDDSPKAEIYNAKISGNREGKRECTDALRILVSIIGDKI